MKVIVVGGGIIGATAASELARRGAQVEVLEKNEVGYGCSYGNAGWMTPCFAMPLPMPGMFFKSLKWLLNPESPLYIKPEPSVLLMRWLTSFMAAMNERQCLAAVEALTLISKDALSTYEKFNQEYPDAFKFDQKGLLMVGQTKAGVQAAVEEMELVARHSVPGKALTPDEIRAMEPSLTGHLEGGVYFPAEAHAEPLKVVQVFMQDAIKHGATLHEKTEVLKVEVENGKVKHLKTTAGDKTADLYIFATGSWSTELAKELRLNVPILGGKGYAMIVDDFQPKPKHPMMLVEKKIAVTPRDGSVRIAGTLELVNQDFGVTERRVKAIMKGASEFMNVPSEFKYRELWRGLRPCTPDGVPLVGYSKKVSNLMISAGHQMLGLQSGPGSARLLADLAEGKKSYVDSQLFDPNRF